MTRPDLIHIQEQIHSFHETDAACRIADPVCDRPVVTTLHEYHVERPSVRHTTGLVRRSTVVIANDPRNQGPCREHAGRTPDYLWWSGSTVLPVESTRSYPTVPGLLTTFGFLNGLKSLDVVAQAVRLLRRERPGLRWRIIGPFNSSTNIDHYEVARRVEGSGAEFTGGYVARDPRLGALLAEADLMILPVADGASERPNDPACDRPGPFGFAGAPPPPASANRPRSSTGENAPARPRADRRRLGLGDPPRPRRPRPRRSPRRRQPRLGRTILL